MNATSKSRNYWRYGRNIMTGALAAVILATLGASQAQAVDGKIYPGSMCVRFGGTNPVLNASRLFNHGTTDMLLDCPVVHDFFEESVQDGYVDVIDNHSTQGICVTLRSISQFQSSTITARSQGPVCSAGAKFQSQRLFFGGISANSNAHYFYAVRIPPPDNGLTSGIISYSIDEND
jgi:hypothetical protein